MNETQIQTVLSHLSEELRLFIDTIGDVPYIALPAERPEIICFAGRVKELSGYGDDEILVDRQLWANMIHPDDRERVFDAFTECKNSGTAFEIEYRIIHKNGTLRYVVDKGEPVFNDKGEITQIEGLITPIGQGRETENMPLSEITKVTKYADVSLSVS